MSLTRRVHRHAVILLDQVARDANVKYLCYNHIVPLLPRLPGMEALFVGSARSIFLGPIKVGVDGDAFILPVGTSEIVVRNLMPMLK
jgi:ribonuclease Z